MEILVGLYDVPIQPNAVISELFHFGIICNNVSYSNGSGSALQQICRNKRIFPFWNNMSYSTYIGIQYQKNRTH
jgi:hypothetical protein